MKEKKYKRCPRCDKRAYIFQDRCENCGLIYSRLTNASNEAAKKAIKSKEYNKVICSKDLPYDISKWRLFFIALCFGWVGTHFAKIGKYKTFAYMLISTILLYIASFLLPLNLFNHEYLFMLMWALILPAAFSVMIWLVSVFQILLNKFKVPISIDEELVRADLDQEVVKDILKEVKESKPIEKNNKEQLNNNTSKIDNKLLSKSSDINDNKTKGKLKKIKITCASCGETVKVREDETICPKCDEPLKD